MMNEGIEVKNLTKSFKGKKILDQVSFSAGKGEIHGFVGYNGSGKTVLFKCICGFFHIDEGEIWIDGARLDPNMDFLNTAGIIIETPAFLSRKSGYYNLDYLYRIRHKKDKEHMYELMETVGLDPKSNKRVGEYSLGMKQRLAIAQALMEDSEILVLDEPMNGLDKNGVEEIREILLQQKTKGKTILLASHNQEDIALLCDTVYEMDHGVLQKQQKA